MPDAARERALEKLTRIDFACSLLQHNREFHGFIRGGVPVQSRDEQGESCHALAQVIDFRQPDNSRFLAQCGLKLQGVRVPHDNRHADLICFVNGLPLVFIELKAVYRNIRAGFDRNLTDYLSYQAIVADYNREKDRATVEATFAQRVALMASLDEEQTRAAREGLTDDELALFDLLGKPDIGKAERERVKQASRELLKSLRTLLAPMPTWARNTNTQAEVKVFILDELWRSLPRPPFTDQDAELLAERVYGFVWQRAVVGHSAAALARP